MVASNTLVDGFDDSSVSEETGAMDESNCYDGQQNMGQPSRQDRCDHSSDEFDDLIKNSTEDGCQYSGTEQLPQLQQAGLHGNWECDEPGDDGLGAYYELDTAEVLA
jgi:hypothetical protein